MAFVPGQTPKVKEVWLQRDEDSFVLNTPEKLYIEDIVAAMFEKSGRENQLLGICSLVEKSKYLVRTQREEKSS